MGMAEFFDVTPAPRFLEVLGEITFEQYRCLAELIDNPVDSFLKAASSGNPIDNPNIKITLPVVNSDHVCITVSDNGPGMTPEELERAARAGLSNGQSTNRLGLFGLGFKVATARLGLITEVYTTRAGDDQWTGIRIDFRKMEADNSFRAPRLTRSKPDPSVHGTEVRISQLLLFQRSYFSHPQNIQQTRVELSRIYTPLLLDPSRNFILEVNNIPVKPRPHCHWNEERSTVYDRNKVVHAVERFDFELSENTYCPDCRLAFETEGYCPQCGQMKVLQKIKRRIHGWIGLQRFIHADKYGIDLVRNGRVIEPLCKDLFYWTDGDKSELEYPTDDQRQRGRFIGVIHMDHCAVNYTKTRFVREDPAWREMVTRIRGEGPLHPKKAEQYGFEPSEAPLYRFFQAFRRNEPHLRGMPKTPHPWADHLAVPNYKTAEEMAAKYYAGDPEYQDDAKWFELIQQADQEHAAQHFPHYVPGNPASIPQGILGATAATSTASSQSATGTSSTACAPPPRMHLPNFGGTFHHPLMQHPVHINAFAVRNNDPDLPPDSPWTMRPVSGKPGSNLFLVDLEHPVFESVTMTPLDGLLDELALKTYEFLRPQGTHRVTFSEILAYYRKNHATLMQIAPADLISMAREALQAIASSISSHVAPKDMHALFEEMDEPEQERITKKAAANGAADAADFVENGEFLTYTQPQALRMVVGRHPELFFDGHYWKRAYAGIQLGSRRVNDEARAALSECYDRYLADAIWLAGTSPRDLRRQSRAAIVRAAMSLHLLTPDGV